MILYTSFLLMLLHHLFKEQSAAAVYKRNLRYTEGLQKKEYYNFSIGHRDDVISLSGASSARRQFKLDAWTATSKLQLGAPWPMRGRNQYHFAQSPFQGSASSTLQWKYQTGYHDDVLINISSCEAA